MLFEGVRGTSYTGDIAIDDFKLMDGACSQPGYCDFEKDDWCTWTNADREDTFDWLVGSGGTPSAYTGPSVDHTTGLCTETALSMLLGKGFRRYVNKLRY